MARDYYLILGVGSDATPDQIKSAYRSKAKRLHPDHSGEGSEPFLALQEAWEVLGDPGRRRAYDERLACRRRSARQPGPDSLRRSGCPVEPLVPARQPGAAQAPFATSPILDAVEDLFSHSWGGYDARRQPAASEASREIQVEVRLTREQALYGGRIRLLIPLEARCPACRGSGRSGLFACAYCLGGGTIADQWPAEIAFPGGVADGAVGRVSLGRTPLGDLSARLHFRVREW